MPIASGALLLWLGSVERPRLAQHLEAEEMEPAAWISDLVLGAATSAEAASLPDPSALYNAAVALGGDAQFVADQARTQAEWKRAAQSWERALNFLRAIPPGSPMYQAAQAKIYDYEGRLNRALGRMGRG
ncbi:MAG: hypothetical protein HC824_12110 [Synechococcales cyanobacterium RM1_1_8]|nr:hypothetical protein [Synechococcales cyanobacterium RM1_1_8]